MDAKLVERGNEGELAIIGKVDSTVAPELDKLLTGLCAKFDKLIINMAELEYISSAGLRCLSNANKAMMLKGGSLVLKNVNKMVMEVLELTGFASILTIV